MKELVEVIAKSLVDYPDEVVVTETENEKAIVLELRVAQSDMGKVIGKQGRIAKAIRAVVKAAASKEEKKVIVFEILGLMYSDGEYDEVERNFIDNLINEFEITNEELNRIEELLNQYSELYKKIVLEIFNK